MDLPRIWMCFLLICSMTDSASANDQVHAQMQAALRSEKLPGTVWTLVTPDGASVGAAGVAHATTGARMTPGTHVHVGSVAKTVLAIGVLRLVTTGKLSLDTELSVVLPGLRFDNPWQRTDPIRIRHLLEHTAGLENFTFFQVFSLRATPDMPLAAGLGPSSMLVRWRPGSRYAYSCTGYQLLGMVIEALTHTRYETYLDKELLLPLGMRDSSFAFTTQAGPNADPRLAMGHFEEGAVQAAVPIATRASVQFTTTAADMGRFAAFLMGHGELDGQVFIAPALLAALSGGHGTEAARAGLAVGHGLALATRDRHGLIGACHPGTTVGFRAMLCIYPDAGKAFFVAVNGDTETADYERLYTPLIDALALRPASPAPPASAPPAGIDAWEGIYVPAWNAVSSLAWLDTVFNPLRVHWDGKLLRLRSLQSAEIRLRPAGAMLFQAERRVAPSHVLLVSPEGERIVSDGLRNYRKASLAHMFWLWTSAVLGLAGLLTVLLRGLWLLLGRRLRSGSTLAVPLAGVLLLAAPLPFFLNQSFLALGDLTPASSLLACATGFLPLAMAWGLIGLLRRRESPVIRPGLDCAAMLAVMQWTLVLVAWGMLPMVLWR